MTQFPRTYADFSSHSGGRSLRLATMVTTQQVMLFGGRWPVVWENQRAKITRWVHIDADREAIPDFIALNGSLSNRSELII